VQLSRKRIAIFVAAVVVASLIGELFISRDAVLPGVKEFVAVSPDVLAIAGAAENIKVHRLVMYQGIPGKDEPYRQYQLAVAGSKGSANVIVRAMRSPAENGWNYKVVSVSR